MNLGHFGGVLGGVRINASFVEVFYKSSFVQKLFSWFWMQINTLTNHLFFHPNSGQQKIFQNKLCSKVPGFCHPRLHDGSGDQRYQIQPPVTMTKMFRRKNPGRMVFGFQFLWFGILDESLA